MVSFVLVRDVQNCQKLRLKIYDVMTLHTQCSHHGGKNGRNDLKSFM